MTVVRSKVAVLGIALSLLSGCSAGRPVTLTPHNAYDTADAQQAAHSRYVLEHHHWRFTLKNHDVHDFEGIAVVKRAGTQRTLEMRTGGKEGQIDLSEVARAERVDGRAVLGGRNATTIFRICFDSDVTCDGGDPPLPSDLGCDPGVSFCCPVRGAFGTSVACGTIPQMPEGAGCEFDELCGDDGAGNALGVGLLAFPNRYCWFYFQTYDTSCFVGSIPFFSRGENLYRQWSITAPYSADLLCNPPSNDGWGVANYEDPGVHPPHRGLETKHVLGRDTVPGSIIPWRYPNDFLFGRSDVTSQATMVSSYYRTRIPLSFPGNALGFCNWDRS
ncbi:MAG: hypothetical protein QOJ39_3767 [Candidatus Eremiobacteraeota bacterium]|jgi:hypothetical protein|nr:hypothetical protein [Candidatus Eremiobacteraeota bacterium]